MALLATLLLLAAYTPGVENWLNLSRPLLGPEGYISDSLTHIVLKIQVHKFVFRGIDLDLREISLRRSDRLELAHGVWVCTALCFLM
jgi:hypothetical protein